MNEALVMLCTLAVSVSGLVMIAVGKPHGHK
jgi:hypothetical protein